MLSFKGITPTLMLDTLPLQRQVVVAGTKWRPKSDGSLVATTGNRGIQATLVSFWLSQRADGKMVTKLSEFPNRMALSMAQSSYEVGFSSPTKLLDLYGLTVVAGCGKKRKWYMWRKTRVIEAVDAAAGWGGYFYLVLRGEI